MGARIESVTTAGGRLRRGYLHTGSKAIRRCIQKAGIMPEQLDMLINTGVYPDRYVQEPAFSSLLQGNQQKHPDHDINGTFSFDLHGGGGGMIMALRILDGFLESDKISNGLVVAGDSAIREGLSGQYQYDSHAGAVMLMKDEPARGFIRFAHDTYPVYLESFSSCTKYVGGELKTFINQSDKYTEQSIQCVSESLTVFLAGEQLELNDIDLFITSQNPTGFASQLNRSLKGDRVIIINGRKRLYSAGMAFALDQAINTDQFSSAKRVLFITAGSGITVDMALYNNR